MSVRVITAVALCKSLRVLSRMLHRGGTAMPGRYALKICPELLSIVSKGVETVAVTGTNGKTTSARMIEEAFEKQGKSWFSNRSGANLISGITTEFVLNCDLFGHPRKDYAVIECDEAAAKSVFPQMKPKVVMVTNLFSDQLDRYGDVTNTLDNIREALKGSPETVMVLNADCALTASLAEDLPNRAVFYGINKGAAVSREMSELADAKHCIRCGAKLDYDYINYGHLGGYSCPGCGYGRKLPQYAVTDIVAQRADSSSVVMDIMGEKQLAEVNLPAMYNIYNAAGSIAAVNEMGLGVKAGIQAIASFKCGFGRMENFALGGKGAKMMLVKNPAGCNQVIEFLENIDESFVLAIALNDRTGDGKDISWVWDADFEKLCNMGGRLTKIIACGDRAWDMALRLKYAGISPEYIEVQQDYAALVEWLDGQDKPAFLMPTYSAMMDMRKAIVERIGGGEFWE
ncbi:MAG: DUF1727 domain-containing protein [Oscillospiraceae bacterium]|nr:DUF1727 domain-containing protein [Oscillospiraceae bacterium]